MAGHTNPSVDRVGMFQKCDSKDYRANCTKGYRGHRWQAHHVLPGVCFAGLSDFVNGCLAVTDYDINKAYSMAGMPSLKAYLLFYRDAEPQSAENPDQLARWKLIRTYATDVAAFGAAVADPGNIPVHDPSTYGHLVYIDNVHKSLKEIVYDMLKKKGDKGEHVDFEKVKDLLKGITDMYWDDLVERGAGPGGGGHAGVRANFTNRNGSAAGGWWKPMSMADLTTAPTPPPVMRLDKP